jgi:VWFA-related protein
MRSRKRKQFNPLLAILVFTLASLAPAIYSQQTERQNPDVIRINTELVQTEVMVFDRQGHFVEGIQPDQFELLLNGVKQPVSFFERVTSGSQAEAAQLAAARRGPSAKNEITKTEAASEDSRGRMLFFFLDDLHMSPASLTRARKALLRFVDEQMNPNDQVAIVSGSGQVGFLQQLTDNPAVLHAAIDRLNNRQLKEGYPGKTQISEYMASQIEDYKNKQLLAYLMEATKVEQQMGPGIRHGDHRPAASYSSLPFIENRINQINAQARMATIDTLTALKGLMLSSAALPGRKVVLFLSDGFLVSERKSGVLDALEGVTDAAKRSGVIVYTVDLRGTILNLGSGVDASNNEYADFSGRRAGLAGAEISATQEPLKRIAEETGGRAIVNTNAIGEGFLAAIGETSNYYLLAWRPDSAEQREGKQHLQVSIKGRPELRVRLRNNVYQGTAAPQPVAAKNKNEESKQGPPAGLPPVERELIRTLGSLYPERALPVSLSVGYLNTSDAGLVLKLSMQIDRQTLDLESQSKTQPVEIDVAGAAVDDRGQLVSFKQIVSVPKENQGPEQTVTWHQQLRVKPGLYQVRVAVRERASGRTGSAMQWIDLPATAAAQFGLSSLFLGERTEDAPVEGSVAAVHPVSVDVDHRFVRTAALRFQTYVYNAESGEQGPKVSIEAQVLRNRQQVMRVAPATVPVTNDPARLPYWSEIALRDLPRGQYVLLLTATDQIANRSASQRINFIVE